MKICTAAQIKEWDQYTILHEPIASIDLMERAAVHIYRWLLENFTHSNACCIICGNGNNGGDGLALARMLAKDNHAVRVFAYHAAATSTPDFETNLTRLTEQGLVKTQWIKEEKDLPVFDKNEIIIEALFGAGLSKPPAGLAVSIIDGINQSGSNVISIDIPAGMYADRSSKENAIVKADHVLSFQCYKPAFFIAENAPFTRFLHILDIGLHPGFESLLQQKFFIADEESLKLIYKPRNRFAHKGNFGHALLLAGSYGKMGAAVLAATACLRSGTGLLTCFIPRSGYTIMQTALPEAMVETDADDNMLTSFLYHLEKYDALGIGPGIGTDTRTVDFLETVLTSYNKPMVIDADALNCIASERSLLDKIPAGSVLTPHPKEFERLFGSSKDDFERIEKALENAVRYNILIVLKGHHSFIALPGGKGYFNTTGNAGMATAGSGDVLTGILTGLLAQGYTPADAALFGVYLHGLSGDIAAAGLSQEAMLAGDIANTIGAAFRHLA
ncbi:MAG: NAD(P)H-hydrate dehydratase [Ferruginibacter sp.]